MCLPVSRKISLIVMLSLLALNLPLLNVPGSEVNWNTAKTGLKQETLQPELFEQKDVFGETVARLRISQAESPMKYEFSVEDLRSFGEAVGRVEVGSNVIRFRLTDEKSNTRLGLDIRPTQTAGRASVTLLHNKKRVEMGIDSGKAKAVAAQMQRLADQGKQQDVKRLWPELGKAFSGQEEYMKFAKRVAESPAYGILTATASLKASLSSDAIQKNPALHIIGLAIGMLAPGAAKAAARSPIGQSTRPPQTRFIKTAYAASLNPVRDNPCDCCYDCIYLLIGLLFACSDFYFWCLNWADPWVCDILGSLCIYGAYEIAAWCWNNQCGFACSDIC
ncbi:MAG TPA: hypothetical protein VFV34_03205 [Blastocatellia bacterium]|nr:hypothetical protein [Blastocatellia bacterium]